MKRKIWLYLLLFFLLLNACSNKIINKEKLIGNWKWKCSGTSKVFYKKNKLIDIIYDYQGPKRMEDYYTLIDYQIYKNYILLIHKKYQVTINDKKITYDIPLKNIGYDIEVYEIEILDDDSIKIKMVKVKFNNQKAIIHNNSKWQVCKKEPITEKDKIEINKLYNDEITKLMLSDKTPLPKFSAKDLE